MSSPCLQGYKCNTHYADGQLYHLPFGDSSASLNGTMQSGKSQQSYVPFLLRSDEKLMSSYPSERSAVNPLFVSVLSGTRA